MHGPRNQHTKHNGPLPVHGGDDRATCVDSAGLMNQRAERQEAGTDGARTGSVLDSAAGSYFTAGSSYDPDRTW